MEEEPMDRLESMSTFLAVVETGSLSAAARQLKTPLATVSRKVSELESHLRTKLFNRSSRKLVLTDAGSSYFAACKRILADVTEAERAASGEYSAPTGELIVTAPVGLGRAYLIPILADFLKAYPDIKASLLLADRVQSLFQEQIDVGLRIGALPDSSLIAVRLGTTRRMVCASPAYLAAHATPRTPASGLPPPSPIISGQPSSAELSQPCSMNSSRNHCRSISCTRPTGFCPSRCALSSTLRRRS